jgi:hypothetical protein
MLTQPWIRLRGVAAALGLLLITGCATQIGNKGSADERHMDWGFVPASTQEPAKLGFGVKDTDNIDLMIWCRQASHRVYLSPICGDDACGKQIMLKAGGIVQSLPLTNGERFGSGAYLDVESALLRGFASEARLRMKLDGRDWENLDARSEVGRRAIRAFTASCR